MEPSLESVGNLVEEFDGLLHGVVLASLFLPISHPEILEEVCKHIDEDIHPAFYDSPILVPGSHEGSAEQLGEIRLGRSSEPPGENYHPECVISTNSYSSSRLDMQALHELLPLDGELGAGPRPLSLRSLRSWLSLMNALIIEAEGSELRLKFRYAAFPLLCIFFSQVSMGFPEFISKIYDYVDNWARRRTYDEAAIELLYDSIKGRMVKTIPQALRHAQAEIASSFVKLRAELMTGSYATERSSGDLESQPNSAAIGLPLPAVLPKPLLDLIDEWESNDPPTTAAVIDSGNSSSSNVKDWYASQEKGVQSLEQLRIEIQEKFAGLLAKHEHCYLHEEIERTTKPQTMVLLKRELNIRAKIIYELIKMITTLDLRHAQLAQSLRHFTKLLNDLEKP